MKWKDGHATVTVPRIDFHSVLEIVEKTLRAVIHNPESDAHRILHIYS